MAYHELDMIMTSVDLADRITAELENEQVIRLQSNSSFVPLNKKITPIKQPWL